MFGYGCTGSGAAAPVPDPFAPSDYTAVFVCVIGENLEKDIPIFSKVSFCDAANTLTDMGYKCQFGFVSKQAGANENVEEADDLEAETGA